MIEPSPVRLTTRPSHGDRVDQIAGASACGLRPPCRPAIAGDVGHRDRRQFAGLGHGAPSRVMQNSTGRPGPRVYHRKRAVPKEANQADERMLAWVDLTHSPRRPATADLRIALVPRRLRTAIPQAVTDASTRLGFDLKLPFGSTPSATSKGLTRAFHRARSGRDSLKKIRDPFEKLRQRLFPPGVARPTHRPPQVTLHPFPKARPGGRLARHSRALRPSTGTGAPPRRD